jgi:hypothetical protein
MARMVKMDRMVRKNPHINFDASLMTLGSLGACSSPLGVVFLYPKELRITRFISQTLVISEIHYNIPLG